MRNARIRPYKRPDYPYRRKTPRQDGIEYEHNAVGVKSLKWNTIENMVKKWNDVFKTFDLAPICEAKLPIYQ